MVPIQFDNRCLKQFSCPSQLSVSTNELLLTFIPIKIIWSYLYLHLFALSLEALDVQEPDWGKVILRAHICGEVTICALEKTCTFPSRSRWVFTSSQLHLWGTCCIWSAFTFQPLVIKQKVFPIVASYISKSYTCSVTASQNSCLKGNTGKKIVNLLLLHILKLWWYASKNTQIFAMEVNLRENRSMFSTSWVLLYSLWNVYLQDLTLWKQRSKAENLVLVKAKKKQHSDDNLVRCGCLSEN